MKPHLSLLALSVTLLVAPAALADSISPNTSTPLGPGFVLTTSPGTSGVSGFMTPDLIVGITAGGLPTVQTLDTSNPAGPLLSSVLATPPSPDSLQFYNLFFGLSTPQNPSAPQFTFTLPPGMPDGSGDFRWTATADTGAGGTATLIGQFQVATPGGVITSWNISQPFGSSSFEVDFTVTPVGLLMDPDLTMNLTEEFSGQSAPLDSTPVPEPNGFVLLVFAVGSLLLVRRVRLAVSRA